MMMKKYLLASTPILLGVVCLIIYSIIGSRVASDGTLEEPFFLIPLSYLFVLIGIISVLFVAVISMFKKVKHN
jgi:xanthine/uracil permease